MTSNAFRLTVVAAILVASNVISAAPPTTRPANSTSQPAKGSLAQTVHTRCSAILEDLGKDGDFEQAGAKADALFDQVAAVGTDKTLDAVREAAFTRRLVHQLAGLAPEARGDLLKYLREHETLARTMAFMITPPSPEEKREGAPERRGNRRGAGATGGSPYTVLLQLREKFGDQVDKYANLTTAICVVHDRPFQRHINENMTTSPSATDLFEYYTSNEKSMLFGIKNVPPELLIYVVDTTAPIDEMTWAMKKYAGDNFVGKHFFDIAYDYDAFRTGKRKKVDEAGFTLQNILKCGGVCADQAFFATELGKSIGVPTAYTTGQSAEAGHAWVGFLQDRNGEGVWNFDEGRYPEYRGVKGEVLDPQTRQSVPDACVSLLAELIGTKAHRLSVEERHNSIALTDAGIRVAELSGDAFAPEAMEPKAIDQRSTPRVKGVEGSLELLKMAVMQNRGNPRPWTVVATMAREGKLSMAQKKEWRDAVLSVCGTRYPDFAVNILEPIVASVDDPVQQNQWWDTVFNMYQGRADLAAAIRMHQAKLWEDQKQPAKAGQYYEDVINRYTNAGPFVIDALQGAEKLLADKPDKVLKLYEQTFAKALRPQDSAFMYQSNWYRIGTAYAGKLRSANQAQKADAVTAQLSPQKAAN